MSPLRPDVDQGVRAQEVAVNPPQPAASSTGPAEPPMEVSAVEHRDGVLARLRASGRDYRLTSPATTVARGWASKLRQFGVEGEFAPLECYAKGCAVTILHSSQRAAQRATDVVTRSGEFHGWQAGKMRSGLIPKDNGQVEVTWILDSPPADEPVLPENLPQDHFDELVERGSGL
ncbi:hypothetical protein WMF30_30295 [Sorangium sp. So ce134]